MEKAKNETFNQERILQSKTRPHCTSKKDSENFLSPLFLFSCIYLCVVVLGNR